MTKNDIEILRTCYTELAHYLDESYGCIEGFKRILSELEEPKTGTDEPQPVPTRYRLVIPDEIEKGWMCSENAVMLYSLDNQEVDVQFRDTTSPMVMMTANGGEQLGYPCEKSWLVPIENEPVVSFEGWLNGVFGWKSHSNTIFNIEDMRLSFEQGGETNELKHQEKTSHYEWYKTYDYVDKACAEIALDAWNACLKSHGITHD